MGMRRPSRGVPMVIYNERLLKALLFIRLDPFPIMLQVFGSDLCIALQGFSFFMSCLSSDLGYVIVKFTSINLVGCMSNSCIALTQHVTYREISWCETSPGRVLSNFTSCGSIVLDGQMKTIIYRFYTTPPQFLHRVSTPFISFLIFSASFNLPLTRTFLNST